MRITNVISSLGAGGAEYIMGLLSDLWIKKGKHVEVVTRSYGPQPENKVILNPAIRVTNVIGSEVSRNWPPRTKKIAALLALRSAIKKSRPDVVISYMDTTSIETIIALIGTGIPVIVAVHCDPNTRPLGMESVDDGSGTYRQNIRSYIYECLRPIVYPYAFSVVCLTETAMSYFSDRIRKKGRIIPNPVIEPHGTVSLSQNDQHNMDRLVALCRFSVVKGLDLMLTAFSKIASRHRSWRLELWGEGEIEQSLRQLSRDLGIENQVIFPGWTPNPYAVLNGAKIFIMSSKTEGFPMALCQAMACGVPAVSFDCPSGPRHIIRDGVDGVLVPNGDVDALAEVMDRLMSNEKERSEYAERSVDILERYGVERILGMWEELLNQACKS